MWSLCLGLILAFTLIESCRGRWVDTEEILEENKGLSFGAGYRRPVPATDDTVLSVAEWAAGQLHGQLVRVNTAEEQVVQGMMYYINFTMNDVHKKKRVCYVKIWQRVWLDSTKMMHHKCA